MSVVSMESSSPIIIIANHGRFLSLSLVGATWAVMCPQHWLRSHLEKSNHTGPADPGKQGRALVVELTIGDSAKDRTAVIR